MATATATRGARGQKVPPATTVLFVRHGTTPSTGKILPGRAAGLHLADAGRDQATAVAERLEGWNTSPPDTSLSHASPPGAPDPSTPAPPRPRRRGGPASPPRARITAVYSSPLERTRETAAPIAARLGLKVRIARGLLECDFGEWTGRALAELVKLPEWTTVQRYPSGFRFPGGESFVGMQARMVETVAALCAEHHGEAIVAVSHADPIKAAVADAMGTHLDLFQRVVISPCSVTTISYGATGPSVLGVNSTRSLEDLRPS